MNKKFKFWLYISFAFNIFTQQTYAHIDLISPTPILDGKANHKTALKHPPFGAPNVDINQVASTKVKSGSELSIKVDMYIYHPGEIVILYTKDLTGSNIQPVYEIPHINAPIPHHNLLGRVAISNDKGQKHITANVKLPEIEGEIILVVRQIMHDKFDNNSDGSVGLSRVYYHQAAKLLLVKDDKYKN